jgi:hypothetical protein
VMTIKSTGKDGRSDKYWAATISVSLHLTLAAWVLLGSSETQQKQSHGVSSAPLFLHFLREDEFYQPLIAASQTEPSEDSAAESEPTSEQVVEATQGKTETAAAEAAVFAENSLPTPTTPASAAAQYPGSGYEFLDADPQLETPSYAPLKNAYLTALRATIQSKWVRQDRQHGRCSVTIQQTIGGGVVSATSRFCLLGEADRRALEAAALSAQPLPYAGFEQVFREDLTIEMGE